MLFPGNLNKRSQDLEETFHDAGQFYWASTEKWRVTQIYSNHQNHFFPRWRVQDIDTIEDSCAELLFKILDKISKLRRNIINIYIYIFKPKCIFS